MTPEAILRDLFASGIEPALTPDRSGIAVPARMLTAEQRTVVLAHKKELIAYLVESSRITSRLIEAAMRACDQHGDGDAERQAMRKECIDTPPHLRQDLLSYFRQEYPAP